MVAQLHPLTLVLTRPDRQSRRFAAELGLDLPVEIAPVMEIVLSDAGPLGDARGVIFTSENGVRAAVASGLRAGEAHCVGANTARAAREAGFKVRQTGRTADELVAALLAAEDVTGPLLHLSGEHTRGEVAERLSAAGLPTEARVVYRQDERALPQALVARLRDGAPVLLPLFSPRSAALVSAQVGRAPGAAVICLSDAVRAACTLEAETVETCAAPTGDAMREALYRRAAAKALEGPKA